MTSGTLLFGLFNLIYGTWQLVLGVEVRRTDKTLRPADSERPPQRTSA